jgi:hypothetical protein
MKTNGTQSTGTFQKNIKAFKRLGGTYKLSQAWIQNLIIHSVETFLQNYGRRPG